MLHVVRKPATMAEFQEMLEALGSNNRALAIRDPGICNRVEQITKDLLGRA